MNCPKCNGKSYVTHNRKFPNYDRRRRVCRECGAVFSTYEILKPADERYPFGHPKKEEPAKKKQPCKFNQGVACSDENQCKTCGWSQINSKEEGGNG